jgi:hypothetical protein
VTDEPIARTTDPDGRDVVFDESSYRHLSERRPVFLRYIELILETVARPDHRAPDPAPDRERFYRQNVLEPRRWLRVVVDFGETPGRIVTVLVQSTDPRNIR